MDASIGNADWTKQSWDLPTDIGYYHAMYGDDLREYVAKIMTLPVSKAMPDSLRDEFASAFPDLFDDKPAPALVSTEQVKKNAVEILEQTIEALKSMLEGKGAQRHVRDSAYWGAPVGTPLPLPPGYGRGSSSLPMSLPTPSLPTPRRHNVADLSPARSRVKNTKTVPSFDSVFAEARKSRTLDVSYTDKKTGITVDVEHNKGQYYDVTVSYEGKRLYSASKFIRTRDKAYRWANYQLKKPYIDAIFERDMGKKRKTKGFADMYWGRYGVDWSEDGPGFVDEDDVDGRWAAALAEAQDLGVEYIAQRGTSYEIHFESVESINSLMRVHEEMLPGFTAYVPKVAVRPMPSGAVAYNGVIKGSSPLVQMTTHNDNLIFIDPDKDYDYTAIGLARTYFADDWDENAAYKLLRYDDKKWWSVYPREIAESNEWEDWEALIFSAVTHELGHTFGRIVFAELGSYQDGQFPARLKYELLEEMRQIFLKYGVIYDSTDYPQSYITPGKDQMQFDKSIITELLSEYGSTSLHEMFAEAWAEYMLADTPRPFAQELGELLRGGMEKWLAHEYRDA